MYTTAQAAEKLEVNKMTLIRWHKTDKFNPAQVEPISGTRLYDEDEINLYALWFRLRRRHKQHLRELDEIQKDDYKYIAIIPLDEHKISWQPVSIDELKERSQKIRQWEEEYQKIMKGYWDIPQGFEPKIDVPDPGLGWSSGNKTSL